MPRHEGTDATRHLPPVSPSSERTPPTHRSTPMLNQPKLDAWIIPVVVVGLIVLMLVGVSITNSRSTAGADTSRPTAAAVAVDAAPERPASAPAAQVNVAPGDPADLRAPSDMVTAYWEPNGTALTIAVDEVISLIAGCPAHAHLVLAQLVGGNQVWVLPADVGDPPDIGAYLPPHPGATCAPPTPTPLPAQCAQLPVAPLAAVAPASPPPPPAPLLVVPTAPPAPTAEPAATPECSRLARQGRPCRLAP